MKKVTYICLSKGNKAFVKLRNKMKNYTIKNYSGTKMLIVNDLNSVDVKELYKEAKSLDIPFAVKQDIGVQIWGLSVVCNFLGIKDSSKF